MLFVLYCLVGCRRLLFQIWCSVENIVKNTAIDCETDCNSMNGGIFAGTWYDGGGLGGEVPAGFGCVVSRYEDCV